MLNTPLSRRAPVTDRGIAIVNNASLLRRAINVDSGIIKHPKILKGNSVFKSAIQLLKKQDLSCQELVDELNQ